MQQLKASIARDLVQGQSENSATRELLKQYVPLNGIISKPEQDIKTQTPVENCLAPHATVAQNDIPAWHAAANKDDDDIKTNIDTIWQKGIRKFYYSAGDVLCISMNPASVL